MEFKSIESWHTSYAGGCIGYVVESPYSGLRDGVTDALKGIHTIDGVERTVFAVESPCTVWLRAGCLISLMVKDAPRD